MVGSKDSPKGKAAEAVTYQDSSTMTKPSLGEQPFSG
jgi:hypothetical protein